MSFALLIASLLNALLQGTPQVSGGIKQIVADIYNSLSAVFASGVTHDLNPTTVFVALAGVIAALKNDPNLPADKLALIGSLEKSIQSALAADKEAQTLVDPSKLQPITPIA